MRKCGKCKEMKELSEFYACKTKRGGHHTVCKICAKEDSKWRYACDSERAKKRQKEYRATRFEQERERVKKWKADNPERVKELARASNMRRFLNGSKAGQHWETLVGYTVEQLKRHLERKFNQNMTWENYGIVWQIDHKIPISAFNFEKPEDIDFRRCWSLNNLQPLEVSKNGSKGAKLYEPFKPALSI